MDYSNLQSRVSTSTSTSSSYIPPHRTQIHPRMINSYSTTTANTKIQQQSQNQQFKWIVVISSLLTLPFVFYLFSTARKIHTSTKFQTSQLKSYGVVIQSGATGSRVRVFQLSNGGRDFFDGIDLPVLDSMKVSPGLVGFSDVPGKVKGTIVQLVEFAKERVPVLMWGKTKVQLFAGEEMEGLSEDVREAIMESCREVLRSSEFWFKNEWASVIKGVDEGVFAWVAANYALGTLGGTPRETTGIVELGGASMQVVFALKDPQPKQFSRNLKFAGVTYNLRAQSLPHYGQDAVWQTLQEKQNSRDVTAYKDYGNPCLPSGTLLSNSSNVAYLPAGNFSACRDEAVNLLKERQGKCLQPPCEIISYPFVELRENFILPGDFVFISETFGIVSKATLAEVEASGLQFCEDSLQEQKNQLLSWDEEKNRLLNFDELDMSRYCFSSAYIVALLHDILGIKMNEKRVGFTHYLRSIPHDWTLGAFILQIMQEAQHKGADDPNQIVGSDSITFFLLFSVLLVVVLATFFALKWRRPQVKTIYDLEKGRYIVTRVPR
ncbi:unnamed protein product [Rhodiola kirilowii]